MLRGVSHPSLAAVVALAGCVQSPPATVPAPLLRGGAVAAERASDADVLGRLGDRVLVVTRRIFSAPPGGDLPDRFELGWRRTDGSIEPVALGEPVTAAAVWTGTVAVLDDRHVLSQLLANGHRIELAREVFGELAASDDGSLLAYATVPGVAGEVHVRGRNADVAVAHNFASAGVFRFSADGASLAFVGAPAGGVLGVWIARTRDDHDLRCLTNCTLRAGVDPIAEQVDLPAGARAVSFYGAAIEWRTERGTLVRFDLGARP